MLYEEENFLTSITGIYDCQYTPISIDEAIRFLESKQEHCSNQIAMARHLTEHLEHNQIMDLIRYLSREISIYQMAIDSLTGEKIREGLRDLFGQDPFKKDSGQGIGQKDEKLP